MWYINKYTTRDIGKKYTTWYIGQDVIRDRIEKGNNRSYENKKKCGIKLFHTGFHF